MNRCRSNTSFSVKNSLLENLVVSVSGDSLSSETSNRLNQVLELFFSVAVVKLFVDVSEVVDIELTFALGVKQGEVSASSFSGVGVSLNQKLCTTLFVSSLKKVSKSRASAPTWSQISSRALKTISNLVSRPKVLAVIKISLMSALLCLGSA